MNSDYLDPAAPPLRVKLTGPQRDLLENADECTPPSPRAVRNHFTGTGARGATLRCAMKLQSLGLLEYVGHGRCEDDDNGDREHPVFAITEAGRAALKGSAGT